MVEYGTFSAVGAGRHTRRFDALHLYANLTAAAATFAVADANPEGPGSGEIADFAALNTVCTASSPTSAAPATPGESIRRAAVEAQQFAPNRAPEDNLALAAIRINHQGPGIELAGIGHVRVYGYPGTQRQSQLLLAEHGLAEDGHRWLLPSTGRCQGREYAHCGRGIDCRYHAIGSHSVKHGQYRALVAVTAGVYQALSDFQLDAIATAALPAATTAQRLVEISSRRAEACGLAPAARTALVINLS